MSELIAKLQQWWENTDFLHHLLPTLALLLVGIILVRIVMATRRNKKLPRVFPGQLNRYNYWGSDCFPAAFIFTNDVFSFIMRKTVMSIL